MEYLNEYHKKSTERCMKELEEQKKLKLNSHIEAKKMFEMHKRIAIKEITDEQWKIKPNTYHWKQSLEAKESIEQLQNQPQQTVAEIIQHQRQMLVNAGISTTDFDNLQKGQ